MKQVATIAWALEFSGRNWVLHTEKASQLEKSGRFRTDGEINNYIFQEEPELFMKAQEDFPENIKFREITLEYKNWLNYELINIFKDAKIKNPEELAALFIIVLDGLTIAASLGILIEQDLNISWKMLTANLNPTI